MKTDYSTIYTVVFAPFCPQSSLCLELQQETTALTDYSQIYKLAGLAYLFLLRDKVSEGLCSF